MQHISCVSSSCFHQLRQLRRIRRSLDKESAATLVHAFVTSSVDYCNAVFAAAPKTATDKLERVLNAAARLISDTRKYDHLTETSVLKVFSDILLALDSGNLAMLTMLDLSGE